MTGQQHGNHGGDDCHHSRHNHHGRVFALLATGRHHRGCRRGGSGTASRQLCLPEGEERRSAGHRQIDSMPGIPRRRAQEKTGREVKIANKWKGETSPLSDSNLLMHNQVTLSVGTRSTLEIAMRWVPSFSFDFIF